MPRGPRAWVGVFALTTVACSSGSCSREPVADVPAEASARIIPTAPAGKDALPARTAPPRGTFIAHIVDVGSGLAVFIEGSDFALLYDGGSNDDLRDGRTNRLTAYLKAVRPNLAKIDHVVLSHAHRDHVELLGDVFQDYEVGEVWEPGVLAKVCAYQRFVHAVSEHPSTKYHTATQAAGTKQVVFPKSSCRVPHELNITYASRLVEGTVVPLGEMGSMTFLHVDDERRENIVSPA